MEENNNPFKAILEMYMAGVEEGDKAGYADIFKACAERFFFDMNRDRFDRQKELHFKDIEYVDGYFVFGSGTNSVVHFHIEECPGWKFAIWWDIPDKSGEKTIKGQFFTQLEETLDKFKPSRSEMCEDIYVSKDGNGEMSCSCWNARNMVDFIANEPYLAFCRDYCAWDYNREYHTREEAKAEYKTYCGKRDLEKRMTDFLDKKVLDFVRKEVLPMFGNAKIRDRGDYWSPRYELTAPLADNLELVEKPGNYGWWREDDKEVKERYNAVLKECDDIANAVGIGWFRPICDSVFIYDGVDPFLEADDEVQN